MPYRQYVVPEPSEKQFMETVIEYAMYKKWLPYHVFDSRRSTPGFPDLIMLRAGRLVVAELKVKKRKPTKAQEVWLAEFALCHGAEVFVWYPSDWDEIERVLA